MSKASSRDNPGRRDVLRAGIVLSGGYVLTRILAPGVAFAEYREREIKSPVKLVGRITYEGDVPKPIMREVTSNADVAGKEPRVWEGLNLGKGKALKDSIVVVNGVFEGKAPSSEPPLTYVKGAYILPRVGVFFWKPDMSIDFENRDPILHSWVLRMKADVKENKAHPGGVAKVSMLINDPGLYELQCAPHPWERAFRMGVAHPYYAKTDEDGRFEIAGLPRGDYTVDIWSEGLSPKRIWMPAYEETITFDGVFRGNDVAASLRGQK